MPEFSHFAPAYRLDKTAILREHEFIKTQIKCIELFNAVDAVTMLLNQHRQIIFGNSKLMQFLQINDLSTILGKRPGEALSCIHAYKEPYGCGTAEACQYCGAVKSIVDCQRKVEQISGECRITADFTGKTVNYEIRVFSAPVSIENNTFIAFTLHDISAQKRKENMEKLFFHDMLNAIGGLHGIIQLLSEMDDKNSGADLFSIAETASHDLFDEVNGYRQLFLAESGELNLEFSEIHSLDFLKKTIKRISYHDIAKGKTIILDPSAESFSVHTDEKVLSRIIINMLKNALEAEQLGETIVVSSTLTKRQAVRFTVKNSSYIPRNIQLQIFQRSYSTKGHNRGLGTYSMKLLGEEFLKGKVNFSSSKEEGTCFSVEFPIT